MLGPAKPRRLDEPIAVLIRAMGRRRSASGCDEDRRLGDGWTMRLVQVVSRSRLSREQSGPGKRTRASSGNVGPITREYLDYIEPGAYAVKRKNGEVVPVMGQSVEKASGR
jgi:hypothetical protein